METEMVEPDRTIMIVSIIGLVVIWGSFFYHKFVQDGNGAASDIGGDDLGIESPPETVESKEGVKPEMPISGKKNKTKRKKR
ncbi:MAG: hypothetical protein ACI8PG_004020 [Planctomycetota bacterium]|jgi:hypothetical protein|tara:strand:+ start:104 stop:349 length:246 start_codon:yes stop_codon:yes gene_type:complete